MKKILPILIFINFLVAILAPTMALAQAAPVKCVKLGADVKWTGSVSGGPGGSGTPFNCNNGTQKYCLFKSGFAIGEEIGAGQCGTVGVIVHCDGSGVWSPVSDHFEQNQSCLTSAWGMVSLLGGVGVAVNWIFTVIMVVVGLLVIWGAFNIITAAGDPGKVTTGRNYILYAMIGLVVALLARAIPGIVSSLLGV